MGVGEKKQKRGFLVFVLGPWPDEAVEFGELRLTESVLSALCLAEFHCWKRIPMRSLEFQ